MNVLIVEPSHFVATVLSGICAKYGLGVVRATNGKEGLFRLAKADIGLILLAYELGDMNACEFFAQAKALRRSMEIPAVMFAASHDHEVVKEAMEAGITECFSKQETRRLEEFIAQFSSSITMRYSGRVMLVEDSKTAALFVTKVLKEMGLDVELFPTAEEAIATFQRKVYDLVITDYVLGGTQSGLAVIREVRNSPGRKALTPILAMSSLMDTTRKVEILRNGANDFVFKPVVTEELRVRVSNLLTTQLLMRRLEAQSKAMMDLAMHDQLTVLYNRHYLRENVPGRFTESDRTGRSISLTIIDINHFKQVNDTYGHDMGDNVLVAFANSLKAHIAEDDLLARVGGEEFVLLAFGHLEQTVDRAKHLRKVISELKPCGLKITASFGVAARAPTEKYESLFKRADSAVYNAKEDGRDRVKFVS